MGLMALAELIEVDAAVSPDLCLNVGNLERRNRSFSGNYLRKF
jgi:hypothetical protein